jgi:hypothetical protein
MVQVLGWLQWWRQRHWRSRSRSQQHAAHAHKYPTHHHSILSGVLPILEALSEWDPKRPHQLKVLDVARNNITHIGARAMATVFLKNVAICEVRRHRVDGSMPPPPPPPTRPPPPPPRCHHYTTTMPPPSSPSDSTWQVDLSNNNIGNEGCMALANSIRPSTR